MSAAPMEDGLHVVDDVDHDVDQDALAAEDGASGLDRPTDSALESLRDAFVEGFNSRDLEVILGAVREDVECPDASDGDGAESLASELSSIWERSPEAFLTRAFVGDEPIAVAWRPDEDGRWTRVAMVCFDEADGLLSLVALPDDIDALERAEVEDPTEAQLDEWADWAEWDRGEETVAPDPGRGRP